MPRSWIARCAYRPAEEDIKRGCDTSAIMGMYGLGRVMPKMTVIPGTQIYQMNIDTEALGELDADLFVLQQRREAQWVDGVKDLHDQNKLVICETDDADLGIRWKLCELFARFPILKFCRTCSWAVMRLSEETLG